MIFMYRDMYTVQLYNICILGGGLEHGFYDFPYIGNVIIPTDELLFFRGVGQPPTRLLLTIINHLITMVLTIINSILTIINDPIIMG